MPVFSLIAETCQGKTLTCTHAMEIFLADEETAHRTRATKQKQADVWREEMHWKCAFVYLFALVLGN